MAKHGHSQSEWRSAHRVAAVSACGARYWIAGLVLVAAVSCHTPPRAQLVIDDATLIVSPNAEPIPQARIVVRNGLIVYAARPKWFERRPEADHTIFAGSAIVIAGLWNSHVHFTEPHWREAAEQDAEELSSRVETMLTRYGFTSVVDTGSDLDNTRALSRRIFNGELRGPKIVVASGSLVPKGQAPIYIDTPLPELETEAQTEAVMASLLARQPDGIKVFAGTYRGAAPPGRMAPELLRAVTTAAHRKGRWVMAHPQHLDALKNCLDSGVDILTHTTPSEDLWTAELIRRMASEIALIPTLQLWRVELERGGESPEAARAFQARGVVQLRGFYRAGGEILFGTDVGYHQDYNPAEEYARMSDAGMTFESILASLTTTPARRFDDAIRTGTIHLGKRADLVILDQDPRDDVSAFARVRTTIRAGEILFQKEPSP